MHRLSTAHILSILILLIIWFAHGSTPARAAPAADSYQDESNMPCTIYLDSLYPGETGLLIEDFRTCVTSVDNSRLLLPDLQTMPPSDLEIETLSDGSRELRLSNMIWNSGIGPLELEGISNPSIRLTRVIQQVQAQTGRQHDHLVGEFIFHPTHEHWHFEEFTIYELWSLTPLGELDKVIASSDKLSYCMIDTDFIAADDIDPANPAFTPRRRYYGCGRLLQWLSAGWGDEYQSHLDGQSIQLAGVQSGYFALVSTANPERIVLESNYSNNSARLYLKIRDESVELISREYLYEQLCLQSGIC